jgi:hypothetical protein
MADPRSLYLDHEKLYTTIDRLCLRIQGRFPDSSLLRVCRDLHEVSLSAEQDIVAIGRPNWLLRGGVAIFVVVVILTMGVALLNSVAKWQIGTSGGNVFDVIQTVESLLNGVFLVGAALLVLVSLENRIKRHRVIQAVNRLRGIAHVVDMHQLTKDPSVIHASGGPTTHSPERQLSQFELSRYLDYCSEMLALVGKVGYLYVQNYHDAEATNAVNDLEDLTTGLSRKIWQKIMLLGGAPHGH